MRASLEFSTFGEAKSPRKLAVQGATTTNGGVIGRRSNAEMAVFPGIAAAESAELETSTGPANVRAQSCAAHVWGQAGPGSTRRGLGLRLFPVRGG